MKTHTEQEPFLYFTIAALSVGIALLILTNLGVVAEKYVEQQWPLLGKTS